MSIGASTTWIPHEHCGTCVSPKSYANFSICILGKTPGEPSRYDVTWYVIYTLPDGMRRRSSYAHQLRDYRATSQAAYIEPARRYYSPKHKLISSELSQLRVLTAFVANHDWSALYTQRDVYGRL
jgi:hypothetical protein